MSTSGIFTFAAALAALALIAAGIVMSRDAHPGLSDSVLAWSAQHAADPAAFEAALLDVGAIAGCTKTCPWCCFCAGGGSGGNHCHGHGNCHGQCLPMLSAMHDRWVETGSAELPPESDWGQAVIPSDAGDATLTVIGSVDAPDDDDLRSTLAYLRQVAGSGVQPDRVLIICGHDHSLQLALPPPDYLRSAQSVADTLARLLAESSSGPVAPSDADISDWAAMHVDPDDRTGFASAARWARDNLPDGLRLGDADSVDDALAIAHEWWLHRADWHWPGCSSQPFCWPPSMESYEGGVPGCGVGWPWCCVGHCGACDGECAGYEDARAAYGARADAR